jgi:putative oxidoreductase
MFAMLKQFEPQAYALMRIVFGLLFFFHGLQKWGFLGGNPADPATLRGAAMFIETIAGPLLMLGLFTVPTAFICSGQMAVAYFLQHQPRAMWPIQNGGEPAALYCFAFLFMSAYGAGIWSLDAMRGGAKTRPAYSPAAR